MSVTLVLSGGGAKAAAHLGAARALADLGVRPGRYVATSMGAVVAAALACGGRPAEVLERFVAAGARGIAKDPTAIIRGLWLRSLLRTDALRRAIAEVVPARRFADLSVPLAVTVVEAETGALLVFGDGGDDAPLVDVLLASCALPLYYAPVPLAGRLGVDGGLRGVLPLEAALGSARAGRPSRVVAVDVGPAISEPPAPRPSLPPVLLAHGDAIGILMAALTEAQLAFWRADRGRPPLVYVRPALERNATFRVDRARAYEAEGYRATIAAMGEAGIPSS